MKFLRLTVPSGAYALVAVARIIRIRESERARCGTSLMLSGEAQAFHVRESFEEVAAMLGCGAEPDKPAELEWRTFEDEEPAEGELVEARDEDECVIGKYRCDHCDPLPHSVGSAWFAHDAEWRPASKPTGAA